MILKRISQYFYHVVHQSQLDISEIKGLTKATAIAIGDNLCHLREIRFKNSFVFNTSEVIILCKPFLHITKLDVFDCIIIGLPATNKREHELKIQSNKHVIQIFKQTRNVVHSLASKLTQLILFYGKLEDQAGILTIANNSHNLTRLNLTGSVIHTLTIQKFTEKCHNLLELNLSRCIIPTNSLLTLDFIKSNKYLRSLTVDEKITTKSWQFTIKKYCLFVSEFVLISNRK
jgi:uncharacterized integral membrane protein